MKRLKQSTLRLLSEINSFVFYTILVILLLVSSFALYVKIYTFDLSFLIEHLKKDGIISANTKVENLHLEFDSSFIIVADKVSAQANNLDLSLNNAQIELSRSSLLQGQIALKRLKIANAFIDINIDEILKNKSESKNNKDFISKLQIIKWTKSAYINNSTINITYNNEIQQLKDIYLDFYKSQDLLKFTAKGTYDLNGNSSPINAEINIANNSSAIDLAITAKSLKSKDLIATFFPNEHFLIKGNVDLKLNAKIIENNILKDISGDLNIQNGTVHIPSLYNDDINFKQINANLNYNVQNKLITINKSKLIDINNNHFDINGDFSYKEDPTLNISVLNKQLPLLDAFKYIPDLKFKKWLNQHISQGTASNVKFGFYGPLRKKIDGLNGNPYFDIHADFEDVSVSYLDNIPTVDNGKGKFSMQKKNIMISIDSATHSEQTIKRASVNISPLFEEPSPLITVKVLSAGSIEDILKVLNKKLDLKQDEFFSHYSGLQEAQSTIAINLNKLNNDESDFIDLHSRIDISEVTGIDPAFKQHFKATDAILNLTEEDFILEASGFMNENPFSLILKEKLLEFGQHTNLVVNSNFDSYLLREYLDIPSFKLSGLVDGEIELQKQQETWNFNLNAKLDDSLLNFGFLNYTKPFSKPGEVQAVGYFDFAKNILNLEKANLNIDNAKANGSAKIILNNLQASTVNLKNIKINDKTQLEKFSLLSNILTVKGKSLDIRPFELFNTENTQTKQEKAQEKQTINKYNIKLNSLYLDDKYKFADVSILLNNTTTLAGLIKAREDKQSQDFYIRFTPDKTDKNKVKLESLIPHFGDYLRKADLYDNMNSGHGILFGDLMFENNKFDHATFTLNVKKFQLVKAPLLAKALASISLEQLLSEKKGILFDELITDISYSDSIIKLKQGKIKGPSLGILFNGAYDSKTKTSDIKGTLVPVVKLNSIVTNIPVVGYILTGSQGAISGTDFKIYGTNEQKISVSPLSVLTPGIIKDLFDIVVGEEGSKAIKKARIKADYEEQQIKKEQTEKNEISNNSPAN